MGECELPRTIRADNVGNKNRLARRTRGAITEEARRREQMQIAARAEQESRKAAQESRKAAKQAKARRKAAAKEAEAQRHYQLVIAAHQNHLRYWKSVRAAEAAGRLKPAAARLVPGGRSESNRRKF